MMHHDKNMWNGPHDLHTMVMATLAIITPAHVLVSRPALLPGPALELETKAIRRFSKVSIVSYSRLSLMIIASASQFPVYLPWGQRLFSIVS